MSFKKKTVALYRKQDTLFLYILYMMTYEQTSRQREINLLWGIKAGIWYEDDMCVQHWGMRQWSPRSYFTRTWVTSVLDEVLPVRQSHSNASTDLFPPVTPDIARHQTCQFCIRKHFSTHLMHSHRSNSSRRVRYTFDTSSGKYTYTIIYTHKER